MKKLVNSISIVFDSSDTQGRGKHFISKFIEPGLVSYDDAGILNVTKSALDKFCSTMVGCPVIIKHQEITDENADELRKGVVSNVWYDPESGWYCCEGVIWDKEAIKLVEQGWTVSCTYNMTESTGEAGEWHNMSYDDELLNGVFEHLAIVPNPRYEEATILLNSKSEKRNMFKNLFNGKKLRKQNEEDENMKKQNEESTDKNALKNRIMEMINKAVKGQGEIDGQSEENWYKEVREMLDKLAYTKSESEKSNEKDDEDKEENNKKNQNSEEEEKKEDCKQNSDDSDENEEIDEKSNSDDEEDKEKSNSDDEEEEKENSDDDKEEDKENCGKKKKNAKNLTSLHNSYSDSAIASGYESEKTRLARGAALF